MIEEWVQSVKEYFIVRIISSFIFAAFTMKITIWVAQIYMYFVL